MHGQIDGLDSRLDVVVERRLPELLVLPHGVILNERVRELRDALCQLPAEDGGEGEDGCRDAELVHVGVVLQGGVHQPHDHVELLVIEQHLQVE